MKRKLVVNCLVVAWATVAALQAAPIPTAPIYTNKTRFRIPFRIDPAEMQRLGARQIQLYASVDQGRRWHLVQAVTPQNTRFEFQAQNDGEYWFAVRTLDARNQLHPGGPITEPGLRVVVDTVAPTFGLNVQQEVPGKVEVSWKASDAALDLTQLELELQGPGSDDWQKIALVPQDQGRTSWSLARGGVVAVRGAVADKAGNVARDQAQAIVDAPANRVPRPSVPDFRQPIAGTRGDLLQEQLPQQFPTETAPGPRGSDRSNEGSLSATGRWPSGSDSEIEAFPGEGEVTQKSPSGAPSTGRQFIPAGPPTANTVSDDASQRPEVLRGRYASDSADSSDPDAAARTINARKFQIDYRLENVGPSGVRSIELYMTQDQGQSWWRYGEDADRQSPFVVEVPGDGTYGFVLRVQSGAGFTTEPPRPGETPDISVMVDTTDPILQLLPVRRGQGTAAKQLHISWTLRDQAPAARPIEISFSRQADGPWESITGWIDDSGSYVWTMPEGLADAIFVRVTARDRAGNKTVSQTAEPIVVDLQTPRARIVDVERMDRE